jgi:hypothetical protein
VFFLGSIRQLLVNTTGIGQIQPPQQQFQLAFGELGDFRTRLWRGMLTRHSVLQEICILEYPFFPPWVIIPQRSSPSRGALSPRQKTARPLTAAGRCAAFLLGRKSQKKKSHLGFLRRAPFRPGCRCCASHRKISRQDALGTTISDSVDP